MIRWVQKYRAKKKAQALEAWKLSFTERAKEMRPMLKNEKTFQFMVSLLITSHDREMFEELQQQFYNSDCTSDWLSTRINESEQMLAQWIADVLDVPVARILRT